MNSLLNLTQRDILPAQTKKGLELTTRLKGNCLILYYTNECRFCKPLLEVFRVLSRSKLPSNFGIINLTNNMNIVALSKRTSKPIEYVPLMIFYVDGMPLMEYNGEKDIESISKFIVQITTTDRGKQGQFVTPQKSNIPAYTIGNPKNCNDEVCYLSFDDTSGYKKA
jgi:hypothetical protein